VLFRSSAVEARGIPGSRLQGLPCVTPPAELTILGMLPPTEPSPYPARAITAYGADHRPGNFQSSALDHITVTPFGSPKSTVDQDQTDTLGMTGLLHLGDFRCYRRECRRVLPAYVVARSSKVTPCRKEIQSTTDCDIHTPLLPNLGHIY
jgi:hypothetical protein